MHPTEDGDDSQQTHHIRDSLFEWESILDTSAMNTTTLFRVAGLASDFMRCPTILFRRGQVAKSNGGVRRRPGHPCCAGDNNFQDALKLTGDVPAVVEFISEFHAKTWTATAELQRSDRLDGRVLASL